MFAIILSWSNSCHHIVIGFPLSVPVSPKLPRVPGWSGAGGEAVCWGLLGIPLLEKFIDFLCFCFLVSKCLGFLLSWFQRFKVSWFLAFKVSKFHRFKDPILPNCHYMFCVGSRSHAQDLQELIRRTVGFVSARHFETCHNFGLPNYDIYKNQICFKNVFGLSWTCFGVLVSPKINIIGFWAWWQVQKTRNHRHEGFEVLP